MKENLLTLIGGGGLVTLIIALLNYRLEIKKLKSTRVDKTPTVIPLEYSPVFNTLDEIEYFFLHDFKYPDAGRTLLLKEVCVNKIRVWRTVMKKYAIEAEQCIGTCELAEIDGCNKSLNHLSKMLMDGMAAYGSLYTTVGMKDITGKNTYDQESLDTMGIFLDIFNGWHSTRVEAVRAASHEIPNANLGTCYDDYWDVFLIYQYAFIQMKYDAIYAMRQLNGQLTGKKFLGVTIGTHTL